jgi:hypothetical protein
MTHKSFGQITFFWVLTFASSLMADTLTIDDFTVPITTANVTFPTGSGTVLSWNRVRLENTSVINTATWWDTGGSNQILGGRRDVTVKNAPGGLVTTRIFASSGVGRLTSSPGSTSYQCLTSLTYNFSPVDLTILHVFRMVVFAIETPLELKLSLWDGNQTATGTFEVPTYNVPDGTTIFKQDLRSLTGWQSLKTTEISRLTVEINAQQNGTDFSVGKLSFATNPEPGSFVALLIAMIGGATWNWKNSRRLKPAA